VSALGSALSNCLWNDKNLLICEPLAKVILELHGKGGTVVNTMNCMRMPSSTRATVFYGSNLRPAVRTASFMNISAISSEKNMGGLVIHVIS
jgi:hypothetical protein